MPWFEPTEDTSLSKLDHEAARVLASVTRYLRTAVRSTNDVRSYLTQRGIAPRVRDAVLLQATAQGLLDDRAAARLWADHWARRGYAWAAIHERLSQKGFDDPTIHAVALRYGSVSEDQTRARALVAGLLRQDLSPKILARKLASRGFDTDVIDRVLLETFGPPPA